MTPDERANNFQRAYYRKEREKLTKKNKLVGWLCTFFLVGCLLALGSVLIWQVVGERFDQVYGEAK